MSKTVAEHAISGTFRPDRHSAENFGDSSDPVPSCPLGAVGDALWQQVTETIPAERLSQLDSAQLTGLCRWYESWVYWDAEMQRQSEDGNLTKTQQATNMASASWKHFAAIAKNFGLDPMSRLKLQFPVEEKEIDPLDELAN